MREIAIVAIVGAFLLVVFAGLIAMAPQFAMVACWVGAAILLGVAALNWMRLLVDETLTGKKRLR